MPFGILRFLHLNLERSPRTPQRINPNHEAGLRFCVCFFRDSSGVRGFCPPMCANSPICTVACTNVPFILKFRHYVFGENASEKKRAQPKAGTWAPKNGKNRWPKRQERCAMHSPGSAPRPSLRQTSPDLGQTKSIKFCRQNLAFQLSTFFLQEILFQNSSQKKSA